MKLPSVISLSENVALHSVKCMYPTGLKHEHSSTSYIVWSYTTGCFVNSCRYDRPRPPQKYARRGLCSEI